MAFGRSLSSLPTYQPAASPPARIVIIRYVPHGRLFSANGSVKERDASEGIDASFVSDAPNGTLSFACAFTAQPLASRMGPRLRFRSLSHAMAIDGPEIANISARMPTGIQRPRPKSAPKTAPNAAV